MITANNIPFVWTMVLNRVQAKFPDAVIGGGCLRDLANNKPVKDIDIFIPNYYNENCRFEIDVREIFPNQIHTIKTYGKWDTGEVVSAISLGKNNDLPPIELIALSSDKYSVAKRFDFGICQIVYDGTSIVYTDKFIDDMNQKTFTLIRCDNDKQKLRSIRRFDRLKEKYPDYKLVL